MYIYVVQSGETIWSIANLYGINTKQLIKDNGLTNLPNLIPGQSLIIIANQLLYTVQPKDTLFNIAKKFGVYPEAIASLNNITNQDEILSGMVLDIPPINIPPRSIEVNGYIVPSTTGNDANIITEASSNLTYITPFSYTINKDGTLNPPDDNVAINVSKNSKSISLLGISNAERSKSDPHLAHSIFTNKEIEDTLLNNILHIMSDKGYSGLNINFERIFPEDRQLYNDFLRRTVDFFHQYNYTVSTALVPKTYDMTTGEWWGGHDYKAQGEILDYIILLTYDWGCVVCPPMAIAPINEIRKVLDYAVSVIPKEKILMGIPFYGFDWTLPFAVGDRANLVNYKDALHLAEKYSATIKYDRISQAPFFNYIDTGEIQHIVWYDDARSFKAKYDLVNEYGLRGVSYCSLGLSAPQNWTLLNNMFNIS